MIELDQGRQGGNARGAAAGVSSIRPGPDFSGRIAASNASAGLLGLPNGLLGLPNGLLGLPNGLLDLLHLVDRLHTLNHAVVEDKN